MDLLVWGEGSFTPRALGQNFLFTVQWTSEQWCICPRSLGMVLAAAHSSVFVLVDLPAAVNHSPPPPLPHPLPPPLFPHLSLSQLNLSRPRTDILTSIAFSLSLSFFLSLCLSLSPCLCLSVCLSVCPSLSLICLGQGQTYYKYSLLSVCLSVCLSVSLSQLNLPWPRIDILVFYYKYSLLSVCLSLPLSLSLSGTDCKNRQLPKILSLV